MNKIPNWIKTPRVKSMNELMIIAKKYGNRLNVSLMRTKGPDGCNYFYAYYSQNDLGCSHPLAVSKEGYFEIDDHYKSYSRYAGSVLCNCGKGSFNFKREDGENLIKCNSCGYSYEDNFYDAIGGDSKFR